MNRAWQVILAVVLLVALGAGAGVLWGRHHGQETPASAPSPLASRPTPESPPTSALPTGAIDGRSAAPSTGTALASPSSPAGGGSTHPDLEATYRSELGELAGRSGVAVAPPGRGDTIVLGAVQDDVAWSTIKVPLVVAALDRSDTDATRSLARRAITVSDNDAATALWNGLGGGRAAAAQVESVLRAAGDSTTRVSATASRPGFTPFGQTRWSTSAQASVMSRLACRSDDVGVAATTDLMRRVVPGQRWGLGAFADAPIKGGWGPLTSGGYLVRQMGVIPTGGGEAGVAILVRAPAGFEAGTSDLDRIAAWLRRHHGELPGGRCD